MDRPPPRQARNNDEMLHIIMYKIKQFTFTSRIISLNPHNHSLGGPVIVIPCVVKNLWLGFLLLFDFKINAETSHSSSYFYNVLFCTRFGLSLKETFKHEIA